MGGRFASGLGRSVGGATQEVMLHGKRRARIDLKPENNEANLR